MDEYIINFNTRDACKMFVSDKNHKMSADHSHTRPIPYTHMFLSISSWVVSLVLFNEIVFYFSYIYYITSAKDLQDANTVV
jgi:hypothetical protein